MKILPTSALRIPAPGASAPASELAPSAEPVLLIHGSFANTPLADGALQWWLPGSAFCHALDTYLAERGSPARCWASVGKVFAWSGANAESERMLAATALHGQLLRLEGDPGVSRYHLVAHSHGGNVVAAALAGFDTPLRKLGTVVYLGTPVLQFRHLDLVLARWAPLALALGAAAASLWAWPRWPDQQPWLMLLMVAAVLGVLFDVRQGLKSRVHTASPRQQSSGHANRRHAFSFEFDEAFRALDAAQDIARRPRAFLWQWLKTGAPKAFAAPLTPVSSNPLGERVAASGLAEAATALEQDTVAAAPNIFVPAASPKSKPKPKPMGPRMLDEMDAAVPLVSAVVRTLPFSQFLPDLMRGMAWLAVLGSACVAQLVRWWLSWGAKLLAGAVLTGMFAMLWLALPWLVRRLAFGQDCGRYLSLGRLPPGVAQLEPVSETLTTEALRVSQASALRSGGGLWGSVLQRDPMAIRGRVEESLSNPAMAHSYYQRAPEVQQAIARLIAGAVKPKVSKAV